LRIGIYGGSFDPPHLGHLKAAQFFQRQLQLDDVIVIPAGETPLKSSASIAGQARLELCRLTFPYPVSDIELARSGPSYTIDTLQTFHAEHPQAKLFLLIGADQLAQFTQWRSWQEILRLCTVCALQRDGAPLTTDLPVTLLRNFTPIEISSTKLRGMLAQGQDASEFLAPGAYEHIQANDLYAEPALPPERLHHSRCVAEAAQKLAQKYGADVEKARFAGLWHDCAKCFGLDDPVAHAAVGADYLKRHLGIDDEEILAAVRWHTTGRADMGLLEQVVFVADKISADREHYTDLAHLRTLADSDLGAASRYIIEFKEKRYG
jgi:nicotinate-nucleotide adenylyltransferase